MSINFEASNMAGYNTPNVHILRVTINSDTGEISAPGVSTINNIVKSGFMPFVSITAGGTTIVMPLVSISADGDYIFSAAYLSTDGSSKPIISALIFSQNSDSPALVSKPLQEAGA